MIGLFLKFCFHLWVKNHDPVENDTNQEETRNKKITKVILARKLNYGIYFRDNFCLVSGSSSNCFLSNRNALNQRFGIIKINPQTLVFVDFYRWIFLYCFSCGSGGRHRSGCGCPSYSPLCSLAEHSPSHPKTSLLISSSKSTRES